MDQPARTFTDYYRHHRGTYWQPEVIQVGDLPVWVLHNLDGWAVNSIVIEGPDGLLVFDTGLGRRHGEAIAREIARLSDKPVTAIVYSHHHPDHCHGTDAIVDPAAVRSGEVTVVASRLWEREYADELRVIGPIMGMRALYQYGEMLPPEEEAYTGLGPHFVGDAVGEIVPPNRLVDSERGSETHMELAGVPVTLFPTGGEAASEIGMYLPDYRTALIADEVYIALPNLYTLRGAKFRDAMRWAAASEKVLAWDIDLLLGCHMPPLEGREQIEQVLGVYLRRCAVAGHCPTGDCGVMG